MSETLHEACGVAAVYLPNEVAAPILFEGIFALQHRGQESAGIATSDGEAIYCTTGMGLVSQAFTKEDLDTLQGWLGIGHTRYATTGSSIGKNAQPIKVDGLRGILALAHNGNLVNGDVLRRELLAQGFELQTETDSEAIALLLAHTPASGWEDLFVRVMPRLNGAYSLTILTKDSVLAVRDPMGNRPLCLGRLGSGWVVASESVVFNHIRGEYIRDIEPGEVVQIDARGVKSFFPLGRSKKQAACLFETIYFARSASIINGETLQVTRQRLGQQLAIEHPCPDADLVIPVPDSARPAAMGYSWESGLRYAEGLERNPYAGRTFPRPSQEERSSGVDRKLSPIPETLRGLSLVVVDDSIVRGTTTRLVVEKLRRAGAREIHLRITSPMITDPCHYGVDMASHEELIAHRNTLEEIRRATGADSLGFLSLEGLIAATRTPRDKGCFACFTGEYPTSVQQQLLLEMIERPRTPLLIRDLVTA